MEHLPRGQVWNMVATAKQGAAQGDARIRPICAVSSTAGDAAMTH